MRLCNKLPSTIMNFNMVGVLAFTVSASNNAMARVPSIIQIIEEPGHTLANFI